LQFTGLTFDTALFCTFCLFVPKLSTNVPFLLLWLWCVMS